MLSNDSTRFRKACIFTTQKTLRENTCTIASGDYSTPVSQRAYPDSVVRYRDETKALLHVYGVFDFTLAKALADCLGIDILA